VVGAASSREFELNDIEKQLSLSSFKNFYPTIKWRNVNEKLSQRTLV
jgi:hypothetical protein